MQFPAKPVFADLLKRVSSEHPALAMHGAVEKFSRRFRHVERRMAEAERLWLQVRPLYLALHACVRAKLRDKYGPDAVPAAGPIPAHLLGNMWAQEWNNIYPLVEPYPGQANLDVTASIKAQNYDAIKMVKTGEGFFTSLGLPALPPTFWTRSQFVKPRDREVICHASAWDLDLRSDLRRTMDALALTPLPSREGEQWLVPNRSTGTQSRHPRS